MVHAASNLHLRPVLSFFSGVHDILLDIAKKTKMWLFGSSPPQAHELGSTLRLVEPSAPKPVSTVPRINYKNMAKPAPTRPSAMLI